MTLAKIKGYRIRGKFNGKYIAGVTQHDFKLSAKLIESIMKSDQGNKQEENDGRVVEFTANFFLMDDANGSASGTYMTLGDIREAVAASTTGTYEYGGNVAGDHLVTGICRMVDLSESTNSTDFGNGTITFREVEGTGGFGTQV